MSQGPLDFHHTPTPCQYTPEGESPHQHLPYTKQPKICSSILEAIGNTPLVRLNQIPREENI